MNIRRVRLSMIATFFVVAGLWGVGRAQVIGLNPPLGQAGTWIPFGPKNYTVGTGAPVAVTDTFTLLNPSTQYTLKAFNGGLQNPPTNKPVSSSIVMLNGVQVIGPTNFNPEVFEVDVPITVQKSNTLSVQVGGQPGAVLFIAIAGVDNDPPIISATATKPPNAGRSRPRRPTAT